jgi:PhnB protein
MPPSTTQPVPHPTTLAPLLNVRDGANAIDFYHSAFGATVLMRTPPESGSVVARLSIDGAEFWLADESPEHQNFSPESLQSSDSRGRSTARMILTVDDPDAVFRRAVAAGAAIVWPVEDQSYGWRVGRIADPFGHHWEIGKPLAKRP